MIVHNFHCVRARFPPEANSPLLIDADAVLPTAIAFQGFQLVSRWHREFSQLRGRVQLQEFSPGCPLKCDRQAP